jgi:hypothetical protein
MATKKKPTAAEAPAKTPAKAPAQTPSAKKATAEKPTAEKPTAEKPTAAEAAAKTPAAKAPTESSAKPKATVEVDWGKGFVPHNDAVVSGNSIKVPVPLRVRQTLGQSQSKDRYDRIRVKLNGEEVRIAERRYYKTSEAQPSLTFTLAD